MATEEKKMEGWTEITVCAVWRMMPRVREEEEERTDLGLGG
jgi:hypothetical protein